MCLSGTMQLTFTRERLLAARESLLTLQEVVAKHNAAIRTRYPPSDALYKSFEKSSMGVFNDMPLPVHAFAYAAENIAYDLKTELSMHPAELFSKGIGEVLQAARSWAGAPHRSARGIVQWRKSVSHIEKHLAIEIGVKAAVFFRLSMQEHRTT